MRHFILALMVLLLPLRGWMGDAMATGMATGQLTAPHSSPSLPTLNAIKNIAAHAHGRLSSAPVHTEKMTASMAGAEILVAQAPAHHDCNIPVADSTDTVGIDCGACSSCQACHTVALSPTVMKSLAPSNPTAQPDAITDSFASADTALSQKPPIS